jgi:hypothetical protein
MARALMLKYLAFLVALWLPATALAQGVGGSRITDLPQASLPMSGAEAINVVQGGVSKQTSVGNVLSTLQAIRLLGPYHGNNNPVPACGAGLLGYMLYATDITTMTYNAVYVPGGNLVGPLFCNGSAWTVH